MACNWADGVVTRLLNSCEASRPTVASVAPGPSLGTALRGSESGHGCLGLA